MRGYPCVGGPCARIPLIIQGALSVEKIPGVEQVRDAFLLCVRIDADNVFSKGGDVPGPAYGQEDQGDQDGNDDAGDNPGCGIILTAHEVIVSQWLKKGNRR